MVLMHRLDRLSVLVLSLGVASAAGCRSSVPSALPVDTVRVADVNTADIVRAAETVLGRMHFALEKADPNTGLVRTEPLAAAQFFELWRSDNISTRDTVAANIHSMHRWVELDIKQDRGQPLVHCVVRVQRLSLPGQEVASVSQAYRIHSRSAPDLQTFVLAPGQRAAMTWIDLDNDERLAAEILRRIERQVRQRRGDEEAS